MCFSHFPCPLCNTHTLLVRVSPCLAPSSSYSILVETAWFARVTSPCHVFLSFLLLVSPLLLPLSYPESCLMLSFESPPFAPFPPTKKETNQTNKQLTKNSFPFFLFGTHSPQNSPSPKNVSPCQPPSPLHGRIGPILLRFVAPLPLPDVSHLRYGLASPRLVPRKSFDLDRARCRDQPLPNNVVRSHRRSDFRYPQARR